ncbi:MAG: hypothetical protein ABII00_03205 [Elusimicrobiota bacterium]
MRAMKSIFPVFGLVGLGLLAGAYFAYTRTGEFLDKAVSGRENIVGFERTYSHDLTSSMGHPDKAVW